MKKTIVILLSLCSNIGFGQNIDTKHISLDLQFNWQNKQAFGAAEITASVLQESDTVYLDAGKLAIQSIELNHQKLKFNYDGGDTDNNVEIILNKKYKPSERFTLRINYHTTHENRSDPNSIGGSFGKGLRFFQPTSTTPNKRKQIWSSGEPENNKYWFPCNEDIADIHTTDIKATVEKPLMVISNGNLIRITENNKNTRTFHYKSGTAYSNYLVSIVIGEFTDVQLTANGKAIHTYGYAQEKQAVQATVELLPDMMIFLEQKTGYPYPFKNYSQVVVQDYPFPGLVGQHTASILSDNYIDDAGVHKDFKYLWDGVAVQALANQWFGNLIMPKSWKDVWLNNAFAQYFAGLYTAKDNTKEEYLTYYYPFEKLNVLGDWQAGNKHPIVANSIKDVAAFTSDSYSKFRGVLVLRMLQTEMGEKNWWETIKQYVKTNAGRQVSTKDFQDAVEKISGKSFQWFFDQWIYKIGLPSFDVVAKYDTPKKQLVLSVKQTQSQENKTVFKQVPFFEGKIDIEIDNRIETIYLKPQLENTFYFPSSVNPKLVNFNFEETFLCETKFEKTTDNYLYQLKYSKDILAKQKAIDCLAETAKDSNTTAAQKDIIINAITSELQSNQYWRYRWYALGALQKIFILPYSEKTISFLTEVIKKEESWIKSTAISMLGKSKDAKYQNIYIAALNDKSDRVINTAAIALGKTKSKNAYTILMSMENKHSWKNQNRISALNGLQQLEDTAAVNYVLQCIKDNQSPRWYLATPIWDYPFAAINTLVTLEKADWAYPVLFERFKKSLSDNDLNDIFQNVQLINLLKNEKAKEIYVLLKEKFKNDAWVLEAIINYESQYLEIIKNNR